MIFDELSNTLFRFSLRRLGAELHGGASRHPPPAADHGSFGAPAWRGLMALSAIANGQEVPLSGATLAHGATLSTVRENVVDALPSTHLSCSHYLFFFILR